jgi:hypothetical protein
MEISPWTWYAGLLIGGLMLIIAEVFIPGGIAGVFGAVALLAAMGLGLAIFPPPWGLFSAVAMVVFGGIFILLWVQVFPAPAPAGGSPCASTERTTSPRPRRRRTARRDRRGRHRPAPRRHRPDPGQTL